jgi:hypothetical protein
VINKVSVNCLILSFLTAVYSASGFGSTFTKARPVTVPGEVSDLYLADDGWSLNPFINDMWGDTDKLLSGGNQIRYSDRVDDFSLLFGLNWRFFVPAREPKHAKPLLEPAPGHYADWLSLQVSALKPVITDSLRVNVTVGIGHIGNHGAKAIHQSLHRLVGADLHGTQYTNQPLGFKPELGAELAWSPEYLQYGPLADLLEFSLGIAHYAILTESWVGLNLLGVKGAEPRWSLALKAVWQLNSQTMADDITAHRFEVAFGYRFNAYYTPTAVYVSPYVQGDAYPQLYLNVISFNLPN